MQDLSVKVGSLTLKNPLIAAGSPLAGTAKHIRDCVDAGFGAVVTKTASTVWYLQRFPRPLYKLLDYPVDAMDPYAVPDSYNWMHREHNSVYPPLQFAKIIAEAAPYAKQHNCAIIGSYSARFVEEWVEIAKAYEKSGCDALEINFCCPFPPEGLAKSPDDSRVGIYYTKHPDEAVKVLKEIRAAVGIPLFVKISPDGSEFEKFAAMLAKAGADGVTMFANNKVLRIDIETGKPIAYGPAPGTGPGVKALSLRWTAEVAAKGELAVLGNRGLSTWKDAIEFLMAGASAVQYCTPIMIRGLGYVRVLLDGIESFMARRGYKSVADFQGVAMRQIYSNMDLVEKVKALYAEVDYSKCMGCGRCKQVCWYDAIKVAKKAIIEKDHCAGCTLCSQVCPAHAIKINERDNDADHFRAIASAHPDLVPEYFVEKKAE
jgi:dihydroorotate dehydrogenase/Pyruvate/2-oxoacid:ferredoxin oxidoreductase delta subunit